jgi:predicted RNase H-like HicB family nuclease
MDGKDVYVARCEELGISDFGESVEEALKNLKTALNLLFECAPEKRMLLQKEKPVLMTRMFL